MAAMLDMQIQTIIGMLAAPLLMGLVVAGEASPVGDAQGTTVTHADAAGAGKLIADKKVVVLDIRTPKEYAAGHIAGATNIDFNASDFEKRLVQLDKSKTYLVHCASGGRSTKSLAQFKKLQFQSVVHLDGGIKAWQKAGQPVEK